MSRHRRSIPFEEWSRGDHGYVLFCVEHFRLATLRARRGLSASVPVYKSEAWAGLHGERYGHEMVPVQEAGDLARRLAREG